jgi:hypothetical protein
MVCIEVLLNPLKFPSFPIFTIEILIRFRHIYEFHVLSVPHQGGRGTAFFEVPSADSYRNAGQA